MAAEAHQSLADENLAQAGLDAHAGDALAALRSVIADAASFMTNLKSLPCS
ncbi:hypothetical protein FBZ98_103816 [Rhizobium sp. ERR 922]|nr:hypothetical protein FBZ98_103816 [Rhizobium sp. ERR 922]